MTKVSESEGIEFTELTIYPKKNKNYEKGYALHIKGDYLAAHTQFEKAASKKYPPAYLRLYRYFEIGLGKPIDRVKSIEYRDMAAAEFSWFVEQAETEYPPAQTDLGICYKYGIGTERDSQQAFAFFQKAADQEEPAGQFNLGCCYEEGVGIILKDEKAAALYYTKAAQNEKTAYTLALINLGRCYESGKGIPQDAKRALRCYLQSPEGHPATLLNLGRCYKKGIGTPSDHKKAKEYFAKAAAQGESHSQYHLGTYYLPGNANEPKLAVEWFLKAANQGNPDAQYDLACCYDNGVGVGVDKNKQQCIHWLRQAADRQHSLAQGRLGYHFQTGEYIAKDAKEAVRLYRLSAEKSCAFAEEKLAFCYAKGFPEGGIPKDEKQAAELFLKAATQGRMLAQFQLGEFYANGIGLAKDLIQTARWYKAAAAQGHELAREKLATLTPPLTPYSENRHSIHHEGATTNTKTPIILTPSDNPIPKTT